MSDKQGFDISNKSAVLIGCGGLGCNICAHIIGAGIGKLWICDGDTIEASNLDRQFLYSYSDIGKFKTKVMKERMSGYGANAAFAVPSGRASEIIEIRSYIRKASDLGFSKAADIVIVGADNDEARIAAEDFCRQEGIPLVCGAIERFYGMAYLYIPGESPCLTCAGLVRSREKADAGESMHGSGGWPLQAPDPDKDCNFKGCPCREAGSNYPSGPVSPAAGVIGAVESSLALRCLSGTAGNLAGRLMVYDNEEIRHLKVEPENGCPRCSR